MNKAINSDAYSYLKSLIHPNAKIVDVEVVGKWLVAHLWNGIFGTSGISFRVKNQSVD